MSLTKHEFEQLLTWLDRDPARAGERYEIIRHRLISFFLGRQCDQAEDLADETINRVATRVYEFMDTYVGEQAPYFLAVAKNVFLEHCRLRNRVIQNPPPVSSREELEPYLKCLDDCLAKLPNKSRDLILLYYQEKKHAKIVSHKEMGQKMRLKAGALRARVHRIRVRLQECILECLKDAAESNDITLANI